MNSGTTQFAIRRWVATLVIFGSLIGTHAMASTIISDDFFTNGFIDPLHGRAPTVSANGATWSRTGVSPGDGDGGVSVIGVDWFGTSKQYTLLFFQNPRGGAISLADNPDLGFVKPNTLTISASVYGGNNSGSKAGLGFYSVLSTANYNLGGFTGLSINKTTRDITLVQNGSEVGGQTVAYTGAAFDPETKAELSFDVSTVTGEILSISLAGSTADYSSILTYSLANAVFAGGATNYAGMASYADGADFDNFLVSGPVPEPAGLATIGLATAGLFARRKRRHAKIA